MYSDQVVAKAKHSEESLFSNKHLWPLLLFLLFFYAHSFTHQKGLSYQIFELEDSGLPQQSILPISARKTITMANHRCLEKGSPHFVIE